MPIYEYQCDACGAEFEREQRISEDPIKNCPGCKAPKARRLISRTSFVLKGGGWYSDLYSSSSASKPAEKTGADAGSNGKDKDKTKDKGEGAKEKPAAKGGKDAGSSSNAQSAA